MKIKNKIELQSLVNEYKQLADQFRRNYEIIRKGNNKIDEEIKQLLKNIEVAMKAVSKKLNEETERLNLKS